MKRYIIAATFLLSSCQTQEDNLIGASKQQVDQALSRLSGVGYVYSSDEFGHVQQIDFNLREHPENAEQVYRLLGLQKPNMSGVYGQIEKDGYIIQYVKENKEDITYLRIEEKRSSLVSLKQDLSGDR